MDPLAAPFLLEGNSGEAVVAVHGFTGCAGHWRPVGEMLQGAGHTVFAPLLPGHGTRPEDLVGVGWRDWVEAVVAAAGELSDHRRVHLAGLSLGGLLSLLAAGPTAAATVTLMAAPLSFGNPRIFLTPLLAPISPWVSDEEQLVPDVDDEAVPFALKYHRYPTAAAAEVLKASVAARRAARRLRRPSLIIHSLVDDVALPSSAVRLHRWLGGSSRLLWLPDSPHNVLLGRHRERAAEAMMAMIGGESR